MFPWTRQNNAAEISAFQTVGERLAGFDPDLHWERLDGWLTALAAAPVLAELEPGLPALCGDAFDRAFADPPDRAQALRALRARLAVLREQLDPEALLDDPDALRLDPLMALWGDGDEATAAGAPGDGPQAAPSAPSTAPAASTEPDTGAEWARGFALGLAWTATHQPVPLPGLGGEAPAAAGEGGGDEAATALRPLLQAVGVLALAPGSPAWQAHLDQAQDGQDPGRDALIDMAVLAVQDLRVAWMDLLPRPQTRRVEAAPGRNDPCPCGSGRKFKKCHGAGA